MFYRTCTWIGEYMSNRISQCLRSSACPLTGFFWLLSHVIYLKLTKVSYECLLSQSWVMGSKTSFSVSQQLRPELSPPTCHNYHLPTIVIKRPFLSNGLYLANKNLRSLKAKSGTGFSYRVDKEASQYSKKIKVSHSLLS